MLSIFTSIYTICYHDIFKNDFILYLRYLFSEENYMRYILIKNYHQKIGNGE